MVFLWLRNQFSKIRTSRILENTQTKLRHDRQDMVENICLNRLVVGSNLIIAENINLDGQTVFGGL